MERDYTYDSPIAAGARGWRARLVQEWLSLGGYSVAVDGAFGPATASAVRRFQQAQGIRATGTVDRKTFDALVRPMRQALAPILPPPGATLGAMVVAYAKQHLAQRPRETGGANAGPWVRLYMDGGEGKSQPWCAGFATFVLGQAAASLGVATPVGRSFSCDVLADEAGTAKCFCRGTTSSLAGRLTPGSLFLVRRRPGDWIHTGIVLAAEAEAFRTIEGNTNDDGSAEGYEVLERTRGYRNKDFVLIG